MTGDGVNDSPALKQAGTYFNSPTVQCSTISFSSNYPRTVSQFCSPTYILILYHLNLFNAAIGVAMGLNGSDVAREGSKETVVASLSFQNLSRFDFCISISHVLLCPSILTLLFFLIFNLLYPAKVCFHLTYSVWYRAYHQPISHFTFCTTHLSCWHRSAWRQFRLHRDRHQGG